MTPLELRKQLLVAESELNRAQLVEEWQKVAEGVRVVTDKAKTYSSIALSGAFLMAAMTYFWRIKSSPAGKKPAWWQILLKGVRLGTSLWSEFGARPKAQME